MKFSSVLIANRGEIAARVIRSARAAGLRTIAIYSDADVEALHVSLADEAHRVGGPVAADSYQNIDAITEIIRASGAQAVHPGYGFLSERADFARAVIAAGAIWIGPDPDTIDSLGDKAEARTMMGSHGVPVNIGALVADAEAGAKIAEQSGYPVIIKPSAGGGGVGMRVVETPEAFIAAFEQSRAHAERVFGDASLLVEKYLPAARHVEVQILGLPNGTVQILGDRDCTVQRRYQKVVEEAPAPNLSDSLRARMHAATKQGAEAIGYKNAGTFEYLVSGEDFVFLEVNARLQVEHPVTEFVTGVDLVDSQLKVASGLRPDFESTDLTMSGHAVELRIYAEDPVKFLPKPGTISRWEEPVGQGVRVDTGFRAGDTVTPYYDPMLAKLIVHGTDRIDAIDKAKDALANFRIEGVVTNAPFLERVLSNSVFRAGNHSTTLVNDMSSGSVGVGS